MNKAWVDDGLRFLGARLRLPPRGPDEFLFEPTEADYQRLATASDLDLRQFTAQVGQHLGLGSVPRASYVWGLTLDLHAAGALAHQDGTRRIQVPFQYAGKQHATGAIVAHELTHVLLFAQRIALQDRGDNEMLTDLACVFAGLGKLILNGLVVEDAPGSGTGHTLGYLAPDLVAHAFARVNGHHSIQETQALGNLTPEARGLVASACRSGQHPARPGQAGSSP